MNVAPDYRSDMTRPNRLPSAQPTRPYTDLHNHLIPAVDDGAATIAESIECLRSMANDGVGTVVTTPHLLLPRLETIAEVERELARHRRAFDGLVAVVRDMDRLPDLALGQEIWASRAEQIEPVLACEGLGLADSSYLLVEFGFDLQGTHSDVIDAVLQGGRRILIAHAERYSFPQNLDPLETAAAWREAGALLQVNTGSLIGRYEAANPGSQRLAWSLIEAKLADVIASDHHGSRRSRGSPREAYEALAGAGRAAQAEEMMAVTPAGLLDGTLSVRGANR
jgi:protein-tyrosine phosphatase